MKIREIISDLWLAFGVVGMAIGLATPIVFIFYLLWRLLSL
jgi:hypothetical protein